jgi:hypothetical protein
MTDPHSPHPFHRFAHLLALTANGAAFLWIPLLVWHQRESQQSDLPQLQDQPPDQWSRIPSSPGNKLRVPTAAAFRNLGLGRHLTPSTASRARSNESPAGLLAIAPRRETPAFSREAKFGREGDDPFAGLLPSLRGANALGGELTLADLKAKPMPVSAIAERNQWKRSGDPLAPLPRHWRKEMRGALPAEARQVEAQVVRLPAPHLTRPEEVPMAIHDNGDAWTLVEPQSAPSRALVERWASRQSVPADGSARAVVVTLEPIDPTPPPPPPLSAERDPGSPPRRTTPPPPPPPLDLSALEQEGLP